MGNGRAGDLGIVSIIKKRRQKPSMTVASKLYARSHLAEIKKIASVRDGRGVALRTQGGTQIVGRLESTLAQRRTLEI